MGQKERIYHKNNSNNQKAASITSNEESTNNENKIANTNNSKTGDKISTGANESVGSTKQEQSALNKNFKNQENYVDVLQETENVLVTTLEDFKKAIINITNAYFKDFAKPLHQEYKSQ